MADGDITEISAPPPAQVQNNAQTAGLAATANGSPATFNGATRVKSMDDLPPELKRATMEGIATNIVNQMRRREEDRKERAKEIYEGR